MRTVILLLCLALFLSACSAFPTPSIPSFGRGGNDGGGLNVPDITVGGPQRGLVVDFAPGKPPSQISSDFLVGVNVANFADTPMSGTLHVWDTSPLDGFTDVSDIAISLDAAFQDNGRFFKPSTYQYNSGFSRYGSVKPGDTTQFFAEITYQHQSEFTPTFCVTNPDGEYDTSCSLTEVISGENRLGQDHGKDPVIVERVRKSIVGAGPESVFLTLEIDIANYGKGEIIDPFDPNPRNENQVSFNVLGLTDSLDFSCTSPQSLQRSTISLPLTLELERGSASVRCTAPLFVDRALGNSRLSMTLDYGYKYRASSGLIQLDARGYDRAQNL